MALRGKVYLVGAGPGDPDLLTVKALRVLRSADIVLHDDLVPSEILAMVPARVKVVNVGKRCGPKKITQQEINNLITHFALGGHTVVRLKNGDPLIFGRAGEEIEALRCARVEFEVVPGITAAVAAAAVAQMPLTDRRLSSKILMVTAHPAADQHGPEWRDLASSDSTLVVYMPGDNYAELGRRLRDAGFMSDTPCLVISKIATAQQQLYRTTLAELAFAPVLASPVLIVVGKVTRLAAAAEWSLDDSLDYSRAGFNTSQVADMVSASELLLVP